MRISHVGHDRSFRTKEIVLVAPFSGAAPGVGGVPLAIWAMTLLLIATTTRFDTPVIAFEALDLVVPF
jgi:hypothetical protein